MASDAALYAANLVHGKLVGTVLPRAWFGPPAPTDLAPATGRPRLEIVAHCWRYARLLRFQLASLVAHPPTELDVTYTLYRAPAAIDPETEALVRRFEPLAPAGLAWRFRTLEPARLLRRAIGRNEAALASAADRVWFTDCDVLFGPGCLDSLARAMRASAAPLIHPEHEFTSALLAADHPLLGPRPEASPAELASPDPALFERRALAKATGPHQICHGDVARALGYCRDIDAYQRPAKRWRKTYEDTAFRRLIGTDGEPAPIGPVLRVRHRDKGRYAGGASAALRGALRRAGDARRAGPP